MFDKFLIAQDIQTPETKLLKDVREFVLPKISDEQIDLMRKNPESWGKIVRLTERLEFVDRLDRIRHEIISQMKPDKKSNKGGKEIKEFVCTWLGCDFAGCHKDIEAMEIALLVAAIDAIVEDHDYKKLDEWLQERWDEKEIDSKAHLAKLLQEHSNRYGMMKGMRRAFRELVDADVKQEWLKSYCVIKVMEGVNGDDQLKKGMEDWNMNGDDKKLKLLMDALAECRNHDVHSAYRQFECDCPVFLRCFASSEKRLVRMGDEKLLLIPLLKKTIMSMAENQFLKGK